jgi:hypothetical protein
MHGELKSTLELVDLSSKSQLVLLPLLHTSLVIFEVTIVRFFPHFKMKQFN